MSDVRLWTFANYRIRDILDVDLVSTTYRATTVDGDELRRVRVFTGDAADGELAGIHDAMIAELRAASDITHPHILTTHDAGRHDGRVYVVSDDVQGAVLREFITRHQPLSPRVALEMGWQLAEALDAVHAAGVVHGSINPHTIWVSDAVGRDRPVAYLTGFGSALMLARQVRNQQKAPASDDLLYVGPDQMRREQASPEADRYALACTVYHLMTSVPPFRRDSVNALFGAHLFSAVEPPTALREDLPPALDSVFARALAKETSDRYPSSNALMIGIERALRGQEEPRRTAAPPAREPRSHHGTWTVGADAVATGPAVAPSWEDRDTVDGAGNGAVPQAAADGAPDDAVPQATADGAPDGAVPPGELADETTAPAGQAHPPEPDPQAGRPDPAPTTKPDVVNGIDTSPQADPAASGASPADDGHAAASGAPPGRPQPPAPVDDGQVADDDEPGGHLADAGDAALDDDMAPRDDAVDALVETPSGNGLGPPPPQDAADAGTTDVASPVTVERPQRRSQGQSEELFDWSGGTLDERRAEHIRRNGDLTAREEPWRVAPPMPVSTDDVVPGTRRVRTRTAVLLAIGAVVVLAAAGAMIVAGWRDDPPPPAAAPQPVDEPVAPPRAAPPIVQPLWTTPVADTAVREIVETDGAVLINAGRTIGALEPESGKLLWTAGTDVRVSELHVLGDAVVAAAADGLVAYDIATGDVRWRSEGAVAVPEALASGRGEIFATSREPGSITISTVDPDDGTVSPLGTIPSNADPDVGGIALVFDRSAARKGGQTLYVLTRAGLYAFDPEAGAEIWRAPVSIDGQFDEPELREEPWVDSLEAIAGAAFVVGRDGRICRYGAATGEEVWTTCQRFGAELDDAPVVYARDARVIVASPVAVSAYDFTNGLRQWSRTLADELQASVAGSPDLTYVAREDGVLRALDHDSGLERWRAQDIGDVTALLGDAQGVYVGGGNGDVMRVAQQALGGSDNR